MKHQQFITGFLAASCLFLLISATTSQATPKRGDPSVSPYMAEY